MGNYKGYFSDLDCKQYEVRITASGDSSNYQEIKLAGRNPFVVRYNTSKTPFDPVRTSTATINIVHDDYLHDALSSCAQGTKVELLDVTTSTAKTLWIGYLTPKVYNAGYDSCIETFELDAADCISSLQYADYTEMSSGGVTSLKDIINQICDETGELEGYYWTRSKKVGNTVLVPSQLSISEHNFQTNDTEEYWKLDEVLKEICQYLGFTCFQWGKRMYFVDYQYLETNEDIYTSYYSKSNNYNTGSAAHLDGPYTVTADSYRSNGATISMEPVYNKVTVNANMYAVDDFIPNPFDDEFLINRIDSGNSYASVEIMPYRNTTSQDHPYNQWFPDGTDALFWQSWKMEESADDQYIYHMRPYNHKYWESVYSNSGTGQVIVPSSAIQASSAITRFYRGGTLVDLGVVRKEHKSENNPAQWIVPSKMDYTRYLCISEKHRNHSGYAQHGKDEGSGKVVYRLKDGFKSRAMVDNKCFLVLNCTCLFERYDYCNYINPDWCDAQCKHRSTAAGTWRESIPRPSFRIHIGNMGWSSSLNRWVDYTVGNNGSLYDICRPQMKWDEKKFTYWNKDLEVLNNVSWEDKVNCEGIKMPLSGVDTTQAITFEVINPAPSFYGNTGNPNFEDKFYDLNSYCWIKDLSLKVVREGESDLGNDSDVIYENEISGCSVNDMGEITVKITTFTDAVKPSYSHMIKGSGFLESVLEESIPRDITEALKPEENIIAKYVHQYSSPTKKFTLSLDEEITPFQKLYGVDVENPNVGYVQLGTEVDYRMGRQTITAVQKNK